MQQVDTLSQMAQKQHNKKMNDKTNAVVTLAF
jgi:hypothetical protein